MTYYIARCPHAGDGGDDTRYPLAALTIKNIVISKKHSEGKFLKMATINLQDVFLNAARKNKTAITVFLTNGFQIRGTVKAFDNFTVLLDSVGKQNLIYKHAISTVIPSANIHLPDDNSARENEQ